MCDVNDHDAVGIRTPSGAGRKLAAKYGDPDELLREDWVPRVPGITAPGSYADYSKNPASWIYGR